MWISILDILLLILHQHEFDYGNPDSDDFDSGSAAGKRFCSAILILAHSILNHFDSVTF